MNETYYHASILSFSTVVWSENLCFVLSHVVKCFDSDENVLQSYSTINVFWDISTVEFSTASPQCIQRREVLVANWSISVIFPERYFARCIGTCEPNTSYKALLIKSMFTILSETVNTSHCSTHFKPSFFAQKSQFFTVCIRVLSNYILIFSCTSLLFVANHYIVLILINSNVKYLFPLSIDWS